MENVRIAILSSTDDLCCFMDNTAPDALHYYDDALHEYLEGSAYTYSFTVSAKHSDCEYLAEGSKIAFTWKNKDYYLNIMKIERDEYEIDVEAYGLSLELLNEYTGEYSATKAMSFTEYISAFGFANILTIGVNEVSDKKITNEWTGDATILARLFSLATVFDAELEFAAQLNDDYSLKAIILNVYREHDDDHQGMGENRQDITLRYGVNVEGIKKTSDISDLYTAIRPTGKDGLTITALDKVVKDDDGNVLYKSPKGTKEILAVQACEQFPSNLLSSTTDRYICALYSYDTDNAETLYGQALAELKKNCVPQVTYDIEGYFDTNIGDTVRVEDDEYNPTLYLDARVTEQIRSFTDPTKNETTFSNAVEKQSEIDESLLKRVNELIDANKVYTCDIISDNGIIFKNNTGTTTLTASVRDAAKDVTDTLTLKWYKDGTELSTGKTITVSASDVDGKAVYKVEATNAAGTLKATAEVTVTDVSDGAAGAKGEKGDKGDTGAQGEQGIQGEKGDKGDTGEQGAKGDKGDTGEAGKSIGSIVNWYLATSASSGVTPSTSGWTTTVQNVTSTKKYLWNYEIISYSDGSTASTSTPCIIGVYGDTGATGAKGDKGDKGDTGATGATGSTGATGATGNGISSITEHYAVSTSNTTAPTSWSSTVPTLTATNKYLWNYETITYTNSTTKNTLKRVIGVYGDTGAKGATGATGANGATGAAGADAITLSITSSAGSTFKNAAISTTLTAHVYKAGTEVTGSALTALGTIKWYKDGSTSAAGTGQTLTVSGGTATKITYTAKLEG